MGIRDLKTISLNSPFPDFGMDSMTAVEIKQSLEREFEVFLTVKEIRGLKFAKLMEIEATNKKMGQGTQDMDSDAKSKLVCCSMRAVIALEMMSLLEAEGRTGKLVLIDGSPDFLRDSDSSIFKGHSEEEIDNKILFTVCDLLLDQNDRDVKEELEKLKTWDEKLTKLQSLLPPIVLHNNGGFTTTCAYRLQLRTQDHSYSFVGGHVNSTRAPNLAKLFTAGLRPVQCGNHVTVLENSKVAQIINKVANADKQRRNVGRS